MRPSIRILVSEYADMKKSVKSSEVESARDGVMTTARIGFTARTQPDVGHVHGPQKLSGERLILPPSWCCLKCPLPEGCMGAKDGDLIYDDELGQCEQDLCKYFARHSRAQQARASCLLPRKLALH